MNNLKEKYNKYKDESDKWLKSIGLPNIEPDRSLVEEILLLNIKDLRQKTYKDLAEYAFVLSQYSLFLQNKSNECHSFLNWCKYNIKSFFNDEKIKLLQWQKKIENRDERIKYLSRKIEIISQNLYNLSRIRKDECN